jgi:hypothetical protein
MPELGNQGKESRRKLELGNQQNRVVMCGVMRLAGLFGRKRHVEVDPLAALPPRQQVVWGTRMKNQEKNRQPRRWRSSQ